MVSHKFMAVCLVTGFLTTLLTGVTLISADDSTGVLKNLYWSNGYYSVSSIDYESNIYVGVYEIGAFSSGGDDDGPNTLKYSDATCSVSFCDKCDTGMQAVIAFVAIVFIGSIPSLVASFMRFKGSNTPLMKWIGVIFNIICLLAGAIGMITFAAGCEKAVVDYVYSGYDFKYGPSFGMLAAATVFKFVEIIFHFLIATGDADGGAATNNQM